MAGKFPRIFLLSTRLPPKELDDLQSRTPTLTRDPEKADVVVGNITKRQRALFELRRLRVEAEEEEDGEPNIAVVRLDWLTESLDAGEGLPLDPYLLYKGRKKRPRSEDGKKRVRLRQGEAKERQMVHESTSTSTSTSTFDEGQGDDDMPPVPEYLHTTYSCQRPSPRESPNEGFIQELKEIRELRLLEGDGIGVRAYSTAIAALSAYPFGIKRAREIARLPGCGDKIANLFRQYASAGRTDETTSASTDTRLATLKTFYEIWGVGDTTARDLYSKGWRDLDDVVEHGWTSLSRTQQIGIKHYEDFQTPIPRSEARRIADLIIERARGQHPDFQMMIVGGYRRGKEQNNDLDVLLSHKDERMTSHMVDKLVVALEQDGYITHTLILTTHNSERGQATLPWKGPGGSGRGGGGGGGGGSGFDTLDKALVVWRDPEDPNAPRRRVDIIVSPWKTVGCAVLGWSGATTFERDLRRYCKVELGLKFDSSGVRRREDGEWVDMESRGGVAAPDMETAERRVFESLALEYRPPEERCTG